MRSAGQIGLFRPRSSQDLTWAVASRLMHSGAVGTVRLVTAGGWGDGMERVRGSIPLSSTAGQSRFPLTVEGGSFAWPSQDFPRSHTRLVPFALGWHVRTGPDRSVNDARACGSSERTGCRRRSAGERSDAERELRTLHRSDWARQVSADATLDDLLREWLPDAVFAQADPRQVRERAPPPPAR
jgi:hypothetical protein